MTKKQAPNGERNAAGATERELAPRALRALVMQERYGPAGDEALLLLKQAWADKHGLKLDIEHTGELPPYRRGHENPNLGWDLIVWQTTVQPATAARYPRNTDTAQLESRTSWLAQWAAENSDGLVVIDDAEAVEKLRPRDGAPQGRQTGNIVAGREEVSAQWLEMQRARPREAVWVVCDIVGGVNRKAGWFDARDECQEHIRERIDSAHTREYDLDSMYYPSRVVLEGGPDGAGRIWVRVKPEYEELEQEEKGYPSPEACDAADDGNGLTTRPIERHATA